MGSRHSRDGVTSRMRLRGHNYAEPAFYFVTLCTEQRQCHFGHIDSDALSPSPAGDMIMRHWQALPQRYPGVALVASVMMPNHVHGVIDLASGFDPMDPPANKSPGLSRIIQSFKSITTVEYIRGVAAHGWPKFPKRLWQQGFYDHIIRNEHDLERILTYIESNPSQWPQDSLYVMPHCESGSRT